MQEFSLTFNEKGQRVSEFVSKGTAFTSVALVPGVGARNSICAVGSDRMLKEIEGGELISYLETGSVLGQLAVAGLNDKVGASSSCLEGGSS